MVSKRAPAQDCSITFHYLGVRDGDYIVRAPTWPTRRRTSFNAYQAVSATQGWLLDHVPSRLHHAGNGNAAGYPPLPGAFRTGRAFVIRFKRRRDLIRFSKAFPVSWKRVGYPARKRSTEALLASAQGCDIVRPLTIASGRHVQP